MLLSRIILPGLALITFFSDSFAQSVIRPNFALKSHETLEIRKIETTQEATIFYLTIENKIPGGTFCADKNIFMVYPDGNRRKLISSNGIPVCPGTYKFKYIGEKHDFVLTFPPLKPGIAWIDLIEDCSDNCFFFYGVTLDIDLNRKIDEAFEITDPVLSLASLINLAEETDSKNLGSEGLLYITIIKLEKEIGNNDKAAEWYNRLKSSEAPHFSQYIKYLNDQGIKY